jgi:hypothetical protein
MVRKHSAGWVLSSHAITIFALVGILISCTNVESEAKKNTPTKKNATPPVAISDSSAKGIVTPSTENKKIVVYYFHGDARCPTCFKLESFAKSEVEGDFAEAIKTGKLEWKTINIETAGNEHFGNDYKLYTKSVIVSTQKDGKEQSWKNLDQIWQLVHNESTYREYIKKEVKACLEGKCL